MEGEKKKQRERAHAQQARGSEKKSVNPHLVGNKKKRKKRAHTPHSQGADPGETRLIRLFTPDLTKSHAPQMERERERELLCAGLALCAANKA